MNLLIVSPYYHPGRDAGGPVKSLKNLARLLLPEGHRLRVITKDRDLGARVPFEGIAPDRWNLTEYGDVYYSKSIASTVRALRDECRGAPESAPVLYLNSFFSIRFSVLPVLLVRLGIVTPAGVFVAPRGEFAEGALGHKAGRKRWFLALARALRLYRGVTWHATNLQEAEFIRAIFGAVPNVRIAGNLSAAPVPTASDRVKRPGEVVATFIARIVRIKNLRFALEALANVKANVRFEIYGPVEDAAYWNECRKAIAALPPNVTATWHGALDNERIGGVLAASDLFILPTLGENFGHSIVEAMQAGNLILISDRTPWRGLREAGAGWDLPLNRADAFTAAVEEVAALNETEMAARRARLSAYLRAHPLLGEAEAQNRLLFENPPGFADA